LATGNNAASQAAQIEAIRPELAELILLSSVFYGRIEDRTDLTPVSSRPTRVPIQAISGGAFSTLGPDGTDMGTGSGPQEVPGYLSPAYYLQASQYTAQAEWATDSSAKAIQDFVALTHEQSSETFGGYLDVLYQGDGSNTLDTIVSVGTGYLQVNNANFFQSNQLVDIWTAVGGAFVATLQIDVEDPESNNIYMTTAIPGTVLAGMVIMCHGASGQANTGIFGIKYYDVGANVGNFMGIPRASYPGRFIAANINLGGAALTPAALRAVQLQVVLNMGQKIAAAQEPIIHCNVDMQAQWENNALMVQSVTMSESKGGESQDMLARKAMTTMGGREILVNPRATPGRIDLIDLKNWWRLSTKKPDLYDVGGQTVFPLIGASGGIQSQNIFYMVVGEQAGITNARVAGFISNAAPTRYLFGH
jgi:hypothetical protein